MSSATCRLLLAFGVLLVAPSAARAQVPPTCMTLLTADELTKAVGAGFTDMGARPRDAGDTECPWMVRGGGIARIVGNNLTKAEITAVARAVATP